MQEIGVTTPILYGRESSTALHRTSSNVAFNANSMTKQESVCCALLGIPAVGFPALVDGHSLSAGRPSKPAPAKSTGNRGRRKTSTKSGAK